MKIIKILFNIIIIIICLNINIFSEPQYPAYQGYINDFAGLIKPEEYNFLDGLIKRLKKKTSSEVAIVTIDTLGDENIEVYTSKLFEKWKIGDKEKDNGVLLLVVSKDKKIRIEVGYGLEGAIPDGLAGSIIDKSILPYFKQGDFSNGIKEGTIEIVRIIAKEYNVDLGVGKPKSKNEKYIFNSDWSAVFFIILIIILFFPRRRRRGFTIFPPGPFIGGGYGGGRGGDFSGGGGFGGFGGFGGGMSGGGGASRGW